MTVLVAGASGATGLLLVEQLLGRSLKVKVIVRAPDRPGRRTIESAEIPAVAR